MTLGDWKTLPITQVIMAEFKARQQQLRVELGQAAGVDPLSDRFKTGVIAAYEDVITIELEDEESHN